MTQGCGSCNCRGKITGPTSEGIKINCLYDNQWYGDTFKCGLWAPFLDNITFDARVKMAADLRNSAEAQKAHQETMGINKEANAIAMSAKNASWWALGISIPSLIISIAVALKQMGAIK